MNFEDKLYSNNPLNEIFKHLPVVADMRNRGMFLRHMDFRNPNIAPKLLEDCIVVLKKMLEKASTNYDDRRQKETTTQTNKRMDYLKETYQCSCGCMVTRRGYSSHLKTKKHLSKIEEKGSQLIHETNKIGVGAI